MSGFFLQYYDSPDFSHKEIGRKVTARHTLLNASLPTIWIQGGSCLESRRMIAIVFSVNSLGLGEAGRHHVHLGHPCLRWSKGELGEGLSGDDGRSAYGSAVHVEPLGQDQVVLSMSTCENLTVPQLLSDHHQPEPLF